MNELIQNHTARYGRIIDQFVAWADQQPDIEAAIIIGSRARADHPADPWSDLDLAIFTSNPSRLIDDETWITHLGRPVLTYIEPTAVGAWQERRVLFEGAVDVDFATIPNDLITMLETIRPDDPVYEELASVARRGYRVVYDRDQRLGQVMAPIAASMAPATVPPTQHQFTELINNFWYQCIWIAKKLSRGELVVAHQCLDGHQRALLLRLVRWQAMDADTWHRSRFIEKWAHPRVSGSLPATWALHDREDIARATGAMMDLVSWLAYDVASSYGLQVSPDPESTVRGWFHAITDTSR